MKLTAGLKTIDQSGIRQLLRERLYNPAMFVGKPVIIWRSYLFDGVNDTLAQDLFREYRKCRSREEWKVFKANTTIYNKDKLGICFIDTSADYSRTLAIYNNLPMVAYAFEDSPDESVLKDFPDAEQYIFAPVFQQWAEDIRQYDNYRLIADFIQSTCEKDDVTYRWYNYFENTDKSHRKGCDFPLEWVSGVSKLRFCRHVSRLKKLCDVDEGSFNKCFQNISADLVREFRQYIIEQNI